MRKPKPPAMQEIQASEKRQPQIRQLLSDEEIKRRLAPPSILDTSKYALSALMILRKHKGGLPAHLLHDVVGSSRQVTSGGFADGLEREGYVTTELRKHIHGRQRWITITKTGLRVLKERLKK